MLSNSSIIPEAMSLETALSISIIIATLLASVVTIMMLFARLAPSQRRDPHGLSFPAIQIVPCVVLPGD